MEDMTPHRRLLVVVLCVTTLARVTAQQDGVPWWATGAIGGQAAAHSFDMITTGMALTQNPDATESNPVLRPMVNHLPALAVVDAAMWTAVTYGLWRVAKTHPRRAALVAAGLAALEVAIGRHNLAVAHRGPP